MGKTQTHETKKLMGQWRNQRGNQKIPQDKWKWQHNFPKPMECSKNNFKRDVYRDTGLPQEVRKISNTLTYYLTN